MARPSPIRRAATVIEIRLIAVAVVAAIAGLASCEAEKPAIKREVNPAADEAGEVVAIAQSLAAEYGEATEEPGPAGFVRAEEIAALLVTRVREASTLTAFLPAAERLRAAIHDRVQPVFVDKACGAFVANLIAQAGVATAPSRRPDLARAAAVYTSACASCHGVDGRGEVPIAATLHPPPPDLQSGDVVNSMSPFRVYQAVTYGVYATPMPAFPTLPAEDRWAVAFYVLALRHPSCPDDAKVPEVPLSVLARESDGALIARFGEDALPCLRRLGRHL